MKWLDLLRLVGGEPVFSSSLLLAGNESLPGIRLQLSRWVRSGRLLQLRRGVYALAPPWRKVDPHPFIVANALQRGSYVSLQAALSFHGLIPEHAAVVTSVGPGRPQTISTALGAFQFNHVASPLIYGYTLTDVAPGQRAFVATPEKALLDLVYLTRGGDDTAHLESLRLQQPDAIHPVALMALAERSGKPQLRRAAARTLDSAAPRLGGTPVMDHLRQLTERERDVLAGRRVAVEYLQARLLQSLQLSGTFLRWAFLGGTALRFLYGIPRFSEDLDFSIITPGADAGLQSAIAHGARAFVAEGYGVEIAMKTQKTVASAFVKFPGLLHELGLSSRPSHTLSIEVEVDTNPPTGAGIETTIVRRHVTLNLCHHDRASLLAGKLHAILTRPWTKGRDLYDLAWYLADRRWPEPNLAMLNAALVQTRWPGPAMTPANWREAIRQRLANLDWPTAQADVRPFLEREHELQLVTPEALSQLLRDRE